MFVLLLFRYFFIFFFFFQFIFIFFFLFFFSLSCFLCLIRLLHFSSSFYSFLCLRHFPRFCATLQFFLRYSYYYVFLKAVIAFFLSFGFLRSSPTNQKKKLEKTEKYKRKNKDWKTKEQKTKI